MRIHYECTKFKVRMHSNYANEHTYYYGRQPGPVPAGIRPRILRSEDGRRSSEPIESEAGEEEPDFLLLHCLSDIMCELFFFSPSFCCELVVRRVQRDRCRRVGSREKHSLRRRCSLDGSCFGAQQGGACETCVTCVIPQVPLGLGSRSEYKSEDTGHTYPAPRSKTPLPAFWSGLAGVCTPSGGGGSMDHLLVRCTGFMFLNFFIFFPSFIFLSTLLACLLAW